MKEPAEGEIKKGERVTLSFVARPFAAASVAGARISTTLNLFVGAERRDFPVRATAGGGTLTATPTSVDFGQIPLGAAALDIPVTLKNTGNQWITVGLAPPADGQFSMTWKGAPEAFPLGPGLAVEGLVARFQPSTPTASKSEAALTVNGAVCGTSAAVLPLAGQGTNGSAGIQPGSLDFGLVDCGAAGAAQTVTVSNAGTAAFTFSASIAGEPVAPFVVATPEGTTVAPGAKATVVVTPPAIPGTSSVRPGLYDATLRITTTAFDDAPHDIPLKLTARGAILSHDPAAIAFGNVAVGQVVTRPLAVANIGNAPAAIAYVVRDASGAETKIFDVAPDGDSVSGGSTLSLTASFTSALGAQAAHAAPTVAAGTALCGPLPDAVSLTGTGESAVPTLSATSIDLGQVCGVVSPGSNDQVSGSVILGNAGNVRFSWRASVQNGRFRLSPLTGTLDAGARVTLVVRPNDVGAPAGSYGDTLRIVTNIEGDSPRDVAIAANATGVVYALSPAAIVFPDPSEGNGDVAVSFTIANRGNAPTAENGTSLQLASGSASAFGVRPSSVGRLDPGASATAEALYLRSQASGGTHVGAIEIAPSDEVVCARTPTLSLRGTK
jgi:hypothetical protein